MGLIVLAIALSIISPVFWSVGNITQIGVQSAVTAILAFGMTFVIVSAGIDLSVGSMLALSAMVSAYVYTVGGVPSWLAAIIGLITGIFGGAINGIANAYFRLPSFIATLAMLSIARGLTLVISQGKPIAAAPSVNVMGASLGVIPAPILIFVLAGIVASFILNRTAVGRAMYAVGGNIEAARLSGIPVRRVQVSVFVLCGLYASIAGMVLAGRLNSAGAQAGAGYELDAIAAVVIGGASLAGGAGKISGTVVGALLLAVIRNGLNIMNVPSFWQQVVIGAVIAVAVGIDAIKNKESAH
ncbi:MAG: ABC transporter permease [Actinomycetaceae bacterium]|nr:ABC transporter permease [Actinomycetaceae bacterium]